MKRINKKIIYICENVQTIVRNGQESVAIHARDQFDPICFTLASRVNFF